MIQERAIEAMLDNSEFDVAMENAVQDMLLTGRGVARIHYRPTMEMQEVRMGLVEVNSDTEPFTRFADESGEERLPSFDNDGAFFMSEEETVSRGTAYGLALLGSGQKCSGLRLKAYRRAKTWWTTSGKRERRPL